MGDKSRNHDEPTVRDDHRDATLGDWLSSRGAHGSRRKARRISNLFFARVLKEADRG